MGKDYVKDNMVYQIIREVEKCLKTECFISALTLALTIPDICGKAEYPACSPGKRYICWYDNHIGKNEKPPDIYDKEDPTQIVNNQLPYESGEIIYSLRNSVLHQGTPNIEKGKIKEERCIVTRFSLIISEASYGGSSSRCSGYGIDGERRMLEINIVNLCLKLCSAAKIFYDNNMALFDFFDYDLQDLRKEGVGVLKETDTIL